MNWAALRPRREPATLDLPELGAMRYRRGWWGGTVRFAPTETNLFLTLEADESGPTQEQLALFTEFAQRCYDLQLSLSCAVYRHAARLGMKVRQTAAPETISIRRIGEGPPEWSLSYGTEGNDRRVVTVYMRGWVIADVRADRQGARPRT